MADLPRSPGSNGDPDDYPGTPRWVKVTGIIVLVVVLLLAVVLAFADGDRSGGHGPGRHVPGDDGDSPSGDDDHTPPDHGHTRSGDAGGHAWPGQDRTLQGGLGRDTPSRP